MNLDELIGAAFDSSDARGATAAIERARQRGPGSEGGALRSYELVAQPGQSLEELARAATPMLVYHLESLGAHPPECGGVFLSLFAGEEVHFIAMREALPLFARALGRTLDQLVEEFGTHEARHAVVLPDRPRPALMLPPPPDPKP